LTSAIIIFIIFATLQVCNVSGACFFILEERGGRKWSNEYALDRCLFNRKRRKEKEEAAGEVEFIYYYFF